MHKINVGHPLVSDIYNLCELCNKKQLTKFNVKVLKEICSYLEIQVKSRDTKMVILDKLNVELSKCQCHKLNQYQRETIISNLVDGYDHY